MDIETKEAIELILYLCKDVTDKPVMYPTSKYESELRSIKKISKKVLEINTLK